jgi:hypothetical protein
MAHPTRFERVTFAFGGQRFYAANRGMTLSTIARIGCCVSPRNVLFRQPRGPLAWRSVADYHFNPRPKRMARTRHRTIWRERGISKARLAPPQLTEPSAKISYNKCTARWRTLIGLQRRHQWLHLARSRVMGLRNANLTFEAFHEENRLWVALNLADAPIVHVIPAATAKLAGDLAVRGTSLHHTFVRI